VHSIQGGAGGHGAAATHEGRCRALTLTTDATGPHAPPSTATATALAIAAGAAAATSSHGGEGSPRWAASPQGAAHPIDFGVVSLARSSFWKPVVRTPSAAAAWDWEKRGNEEEEEYDKWGQGYF
jgi:hypothetical protein